MDTTRWMRHKEINLMSKNNFKKFLDAFMSSTECVYKEEHTILPAVEKITRIKVNILVPNLIFIMLIPMLLINYSICKTNNCAP